MMGKIGINYILGLTE